MRAVATLGADVVLIKPEFQQSAFTAGRDGRYQAEAPRRNLDPAHVGLCPFASVTIDNVRMPLSHSTDRSSAGVTGT